MEREIEFKKRLVTGNNDLAEDLSDWALKVKALGGVLSALAWLEKNNKSGSDWFVAYGEYFGEIIQDYAEFIETAVHDNISIIRGQGNYEAELANHQEIYEKLKDTNWREDIYVIDSHLKSLSCFIHDASLPAIDLKNKFEGLKKNIMAQHTKAESHAGVQ